MTKYLVGFVCFIVLIVTGVVLASPQSALWFFASNSMLYILARLLIAIFLLAYVLLPIVRIQATRTALIVGGASLVYLGIAGIVPGESLGMNDYFPLPLDVFLMLEFGITSLLVAVELPVNQKVSLSQVALSLLGKFQIHSPTPNTKRTTRA